MKQFFFLSVFAMFLFSCTKKEVSSPATAPSNPPPPVYSISDYTKLTVGNYWVYELVNIDTLNNITAAGTDSCYIKSDSVYNGNTYAVAINMPPDVGGVQLLRDSSSFLVNQHGTILFTLSDFDKVLAADSISNVSGTRYSVPSQQNTVLVFTGTYICYDYLGTVDFYAGYKWGPLRYTNNYYAAHLGLVCATTFSVNLSGTTQYWLLSSNVK